MLIWVFIYAITKSLKFSIMKNIFTDINSYFFQYLLVSKYKKTTKEKIHQANCNLANMVNNKLSAAYQYLIRSINSEQGC